MYLKIPEEYVLKSNWRAITNDIPLTASEYNKYGLPWFECDDDSQALSGSGV
jgi:hypothetical protein